MSASMCAITPTMYFTFADNQTQLKNTLQLFLKGNLYKKNLSDLVKSLVPEWFNVGDWLFSDYSLGHDVADGRSCSETVTVETTGEDQAVRFLRSAKYTDTVFGQVKDSGPAADYLCLCKCRLGATAARGEEPS